MAKLTIDKYDLVERLATGGMAEVFLARVRGPAAFERRCVIKRVLPALIMEEEFTRLFELEARYAAMIEHPNIAQVYDFGRDTDGRPWLAMEYVDGASLRQLLRAMAKQVERCDVRVVARVFAQAAEGLAAAHALVDPDTREPLHLVHRDVTPENILVSRLGAVKVSDFGIARAMVKAGTTRPDTLRGKVRYLAPEQICGEEITHAVDIWALGVSLFETLTGVRPFPEDNEGQTMYAIASGSRPTVASLRNDCPEALVAIIDRCLEVDPTRRMPDCHELALALDRFVAATGSPISTSMIGSWVDRLVPRRDTSPRDQHRLVDECMHAAPRVDAANVEYAPGRSPPPHLTANFNEKRPPNRGSGESILDQQDSEGALVPMKAPPPFVTTHAVSPMSKTEGEVPGRNFTGWAFVAVALIIVAGGYFAWRRAFPPPPESARVFISSSPPGATVKVNGATVGTTPWGGDIPGTTPIAVEVEAPGYATWETTLEPGVTSTVEATLKKLKRKEALKQTPH